MNDEVIYQKHEVFIHEKITDLPNNEVNKIGGSLQIFKNKDGHFIRFLTYYETSGSEEWTYVGVNSAFSYSKRLSGSDQITIENNNKKIPHKYKLCFNVNDLKSIKRISPNKNISLIFILSDGSTWPPLYFHKGGSREFLNELRTFYLFKRDANDSNLFIAQRQNGQQFQKSLYELNLFDESQRNDVVKRFSLNEPINKTLLSFSRVTNRLRDVLNLNDGNSAIANSQSAFYDDLLTSSIIATTTDKQSSHCDDFEVIIKVDLGPMPEVTRNRPVVKDDIKYDKDGRVLNEKELLNMIFRGGIDNSIRSELWKFLLNVHDWNSTSKMRANERITQEDDYYRMKRQWMTLSDDQKSRFSLYKDRESLIEKDVLRTDRAHSYFEGENNKNLEQMKDLLNTYHMYNFDLGYVQGMSDLIAPLMVVFDNEVDSFWAFVGLMKRMQSNFLMDQSHIKTQLANLNTLIEFIDAEFAQYLDSNDSSNMYFCFRWILILFKREFTFYDCMRFWEVLWSVIECKNYHLLICISILLMKKSEIMANRFGFNEILKFINDMSLQIDLEETLIKAEGLYIQLKRYKQLPSEIGDILGLQTFTNDS